MKILLVTIVILFVPFLSSSQVILNDVNCPVNLEKETSNGVILSGVIDRFEHDQSVILIEDINKQIIVDRADLPEDAIEGMWLLIEYRKGEQLNLQIDEEKTVKKSEESMNLIMKLKLK